MIENTGVANVAAIERAEEVGPDGERDDADILLPDKRPYGARIFFLDL